jgi:hypothetical protein
MKKGEKMSDEIKFKLSKSHMGNNYNLGFKHSEESKKRMSIAQTGKKLSEETRKKMSKSKTGLKRSKEFSEKQSLRLTGKPNLNHRGEKHWNWKGGISPERELIRESIESQKWKKDCLIRDKFTDQKYGTIGGKLVVHHILNFSSHPETRFDINNGITLSEKAHDEFHHKYGNRNNNREQLMEFLTK